ncbi:hypothetical protein, partial [Collinsella aerofaciens]
SRKGYIRRVVTRTSTTFLKIFGRDGRWAGEMVLVCCSDSPAQDEGHIKWPSLRAELATNQNHLASPATMGSQGFQKSGRRAGAPTADIWGLMFLTGEDYLLVEEILRHVVAVA